MGLYAVLTAILVLAVVFPRVGVAAGVARWQRTRRQELVEDGLKFLHGADADGRIISPQGLAGGLGIGQPEAVGLVERMEAGGLVRSRGGALHLTEDGNALAIHMVRAHRLWERYLADEARLPLGRVHGYAERAEHRLSTQQIDALNEHLGHPEVDPHGDPIPDARGGIALQERRPLTDWTVGERAVIVHVEDEPVGTMRKVLDAGFRPGIEVMVVERDGGGLVVDAPGGEITITPAVAAQIHVTKVGEGTQQVEGTRRLSVLKVGEKAEVVGYSQRCQGLSRRRLLDMGLTPGAEIAAELSSPLRSAMGYRIRGTLVALRREQADMIWINDANDKAKNIAG